jgi:hypothetical protein
MANPNGRIGNIPVLPAGAGAPVKFYLQIGILDLDCHFSLFARILLVDMLISKYKYTCNIH